jgi:protein-tyrosine-phosphatase
LDVSEFDIVVAMSPDVACEVAKLDPKRLEQWNISDPYRCDMATYRATADAIDAALEGLDL